MADGNGNGVRMATAEYCMVSPDGRRIKVDRNVFEAFRSFVEERKQGTVRVDFLQGGVRAVRAEVVYS